MKKIIIILSLVLLTAILLGCVEEPVKISDDPKEAFASFVEKSGSLDNYYSEYVIEMDTMGQSVMSNVKTYVKGGKQKATMRMKAGGGLTSLMEMGFDTYLFGEDNLVMCIEPSAIMSMPMLSMGSSAALDPELLEQEMCIVMDKTAMASLNSFGSVPENFDILLDNEFTYLGKKTVAGKYNCHEYSFSLSYAEVMSLATGSELSSAYSLGYDDLKINYNMCFEEKFGILAELSYDINMPSMSGSYGSYGSTSSFISTKITLKDFRLGVNDSDLAPKTKIAMASSVQTIDCSNGVVKVDLALLDKVSSLNVSIKESMGDGQEVYSKTVSVNPVLFETQSIKVDFEKDLWNTNLVSVCAGTSCMKGTCYANGYTPYSGISETQAKATWKSVEPFAIIDWGQTGSELTVVLQNNSFETLGFNKFYLTTNGELSEKGDLGEDYNDASKMIAAGATYVIKINTSTSCNSSGKFSHKKSGISIDYNTPNINNKTQMAVADIIGTC